MRLGDEQVRRVCSAVLGRWKAKGLIRPKAQDDALLSRMAAEIHDDVRREEELDREAEALLEKHLGEIGHSQANTRILFQKIKERLARERDVVL